MSNTAIENIQSEITNLLGDSLTMEQRAKFKQVFEDAKTSLKEDMKNICFETLRTCDDDSPLNESLNDYFESVYDRVFNQPPLNRG